MPLKINITPKLKYHLPVCTLTESECKSIMYPLIKVALPRSGITANLPTEFRDGIISSGGIGVYYIFHYQGAARTAHVKHCYSKTTNGSHLITCIEVLTLE